MEVMQPLPTHFDPNGLVCTRIDRAWVALSSMFMKLQVSSTVVSSPEKLCGDGLSIHAPVALSLEETQN